MKFSGLIASCDNEVSISLEERRAIEAIKKLKDRIRQPIEVTVDLASGVMMSGLADGMVSGMGRVTDQPLEPPKETQRERIMREREEKKARARVIPPRR